VNLDRGAVFLGHRSHRAEEPPAGSPSAALYKRELAPYKPAGGITSPSRFRDLFNLQPPEPRRSEIL